MVVAVAAHALGPGQLGEYDRPQAHPSRSDAGTDRRDVAVGDDAAPVDHDDPPGQLLHLGHVVATEYDGSTVGVEVADRCPDVTPGFHIEAGGGLIEQDQFRAAHEGERERESALLTSGQRAGLVVRLAGKTEPLEQRAGGIGSG